MADAVILFAGGFSDAPSDAVPVGSVQAALAVRSKGHGGPAAFDLLTPCRFDAPVHEALIAGRRICTNRVAALLATGAGSVRLAGARDPLALPPGDGLEATERRIHEAAAKLYGAAFLEQLAAQSAEAWTRRNRHLHYLRCMLHEVGRSDRLRGVAQDLLPLAQPADLGESRHALAR